MSLKLVAPGKRKNNKFYLALGKINGRYYEISTRTRDKVAAQRIKADAEARIRASGQATNRLTFGEAIDRYIAYRDPSLDDVRRLNALKEAIGERPVADIRQDDLTEAANRICPGFKNSSKNRNVIVPAAAVLHYAAENEWCGYRRFAKYREPKAETRALKEQDAAKLLKATEGKPRLLLLWLFFQGNRISEALSVEGKNLDLKRGVGKVWIGKTQSWREFVLDARVVAELKTQKIGEGKLFPWANRWAAYKALAPAISESGVRFTPHMARHSLGTWLASAGASQRLIQEALGHADLKSSARYQGAEVKAVRENLARVGRKVGGR
jgi:integrase